MVSVGVLAAIVNLIVLLLVTVADRLITLIVKNLVSRTLHAVRRAPIVHDSDTWLLNIPRSIVKYRRHPGILFTIICGVALVASELITELGVDVSNQCSPATKVGHVISADSNPDSVWTQVELATAVSYLQRVKFLNNLDRVPAGLPISISGNECLNCMQKPDYVSILEGCSAVHTRTYNPGELRIFIETTNGPFKTITKCFKETSSPFEKYGNTSTPNSMGDLTGNGMQYAAFVLQRVSETHILYLEYGNQEHISNLLQQARHFPRGTSADLTKSDVRVTELKCAINRLDQYVFLQALSVYRTIQLENMITSAKFILEEKRFTGITPVDLYKAGLSVKLIEDQLTDGTYYVYTTCGSYNWRFLLPFSLCLTLIFSLLFISFGIRREPVSRMVPCNSRGWFRYSLCNLKTENDWSCRTVADPYFERTIDEMVLIEEADGESYRLGIQQRDLRRQAVANDWMGTEVSTHIDTEFV